MDDRCAPDYLRVILQRVPEEIFEPDSIAEAPLVAFCAYTLQHRLFGWVRLHADRLTDLLNGHASLLLTDVGVEGLEDGRTTTAERVLIERSDLVAVHASGPRGNAGLRHRTRAHPVALQSGNYLVGGHLHGPPGLEPLEDFGARPAMVPLTDSWIEYWSGDERRRHAIGTIIVNRERVDWIRPVTDDDLVEGTLRPTPRAAMLSG